MRRIGIIGGMGAAAGVRMAQQLVRECQINGAAKDSDFPDFVLRNVAFKDTDELGSFGLEAKMQLCDAVNLLLRAECQVAMLACNTLHDALNACRVWSANIMTWVDMIDCACQKVIRQQAVGVLCSLHAGTLGIYPERLKTLGIKTVEVSEHQQPVVDSAIAAAIAGQQNRHHGERLGEIITDMQERGAQSVILGCTELPLIDLPPNLGVPIVDPGLAAVQKALAMSADPNP